MHSSKADPEELARLVGGVRKADVGFLLNENNDSSYRLARLVDGDSPKAFPYSIANFPTCEKP